MMRRAPFVSTFALATLFILALPVAAHAYGLGAGEIPMFWGGPTVNEATNLDSEGLTPVPPGTAVTFGGSWMSMTRGLARTAPLNTLLTLEIRKGSFEGDVVASISRDEFMDYWSGEHLPAAHEWWDPAWFEPFNPRLGCVLYYNDWRYTIALDPGVYYVRATGFSPRTSVDLLAGDQEHGVYRIPPGGGEAYYYFTVQ